MKFVPILLVLLVLVACKKEGGGSSSGTNGNGGLCSLSGGTDCPTPNPSEETPFSVGYVDPQSGTMDFGADETISVQLNRAINVSSLIYNSGTPAMDNVVLKDETGEEVLLSVNAQNDLLQIKPMFSLTPGRRYTLTLKTSITDTNAKNLDKELVSTFGVASGAGSNPGTQPMLSWSNESNVNSHISVDRFELHYGQTQKSGSNFQYQRSVSIPVNQAAYDAATGKYSFELKDQLESNKMYYYSMKACNASGCSDYSGEASKLQP